jgi:predicted DNA-binding ribbon-helix-helix protein
MLPVGDGKRMPLRLDTPTWQAVEWLAEQSSQTWQEWCATTLAAAGPDIANMTAAIRAAAMNALLAETIFADRAEQFSGVQAVGMRMAGQCDDKTFNDDLRQSVIESESECGGFNLRSGIDPNGRVSFWIQNGLRDGPHIIVRTPFAPEEWQKALEAINED